MATQKKEEELSIASRDQIRSMTTPESNTYKVTFDLIHPDKSFNVREDYGDIEELANSILENGLIQPLIGDFMVNAKDEMFFRLTDGYRRFSAIKLLVERGVEVGKITCRINEKGISTEDRYFKMFVTADNKQLTSIEISGLFRRLVNLGVEIETIAKKVSKSPTYVTDLLVLSQLPETVKNAVANNQASATAVIFTAKKLGSDKTKKAVEKSISENKKYSVKTAQEEVLPTDQKKIEYKGDLPGKYDNETKEERDFRRKYERMTVLPTEISEMQNLEKYLLSLEERKPDQLKLLIAVQGKIKIRLDAGEVGNTKDTSAQDEVNEKAAANFYVNVSFTGVINVSFKEFCVKFCADIGNDNAVFIWNYFKSKTIEDK